MSIYSIIGAVIVVFALVAYSLAIITEQRKHRVSRFVIRFLTIGIVLDITATAFMIIGSSNGPFTVHGLLGYSSLIAMMIDTILIWKFYSRYEYNTKVPRSLHIYSRYAYIWWVLAFITGLLLVIVK